MSPLGTPISFMWVVARGDGVTSSAGLFLRSLQRGLWLWCRLNRDRVGQKPVLLLLARLCEEGQLPLLEQLHLMRRAYAIKARLFAYAVLRGCLVRRWWCVLLREAQPFTCTLSGLRRAVQVLPVGMRLCRRWYANRHRIRRRRSMCKTGARSHAGDCRGFGLARQRPQVRYAVRLRGHLPNLSGTRPPKQRPTAYAYGTY